MEQKTGVATTVAPKEGDEFWWNLMVETLEDVFYEPDVQAVRAIYAAIAAHDLTDGQPVWPMLVAPPGSAKTTILQPLGQFEHVHPIDKLTPNTFLSGQFGQSERKRKPSLLHRVGASGIIVFPDFSTVLAMRPDDKAAILADLRRIFDGRLRKEVGTSGEALEWIGRITCAVAVTPDIDRHYSVFQSLGERFVMIRWHRPGGEEHAEQAALHAMNQNPKEVQENLTLGVDLLFEDLPDGPIRVPEAIQRQIAALGEFVVRARTHVPRGHDKHLIYMPEAEASTRLSQQLCQLARGSARLSRRLVANDEDMELVTRVGFDCIPSIRREILHGHVDPTHRTTTCLPKATRSYAQEDMVSVKLLRKRGKTEQYELTPFARRLLETLGFTRYPHRTS